MSEIRAGGAHRTPAEPWHGRDDGPGSAHRRWHTAVSQATGQGLSLAGFACDEGVRRNHGRPGAFDGPRAIRSQLASLAFHGSFGVRDLGDVVVSGSALEAGQEQLGETVAEGLKDGLTIVLGGGHETAYGTFLGLEKAGLLRPERRLGILNLDAHFDLREADRASSGTPFRQIAARQQAAGREFVYAVVGASWHNNTEKLFRTAWALGTQMLMDEDCSEEEVVGFVRSFAESVDDLYLTIDLDVLPAYVAPGVSAPAALGVDLRIVFAVIRAVGFTGKLRVADVVELNPSLDADGRTARTAARIVAEIATTALDKQ